MKKFLIILFCFVSVCSYAQINPQPKKVTEKFFPEPEIEINTPAFLKKKGFTDYDELINFINGLLKDHSDLMSLKFIGESQKGKQIPLIHLNRNNQQEKIKVWIQARMHGDEPASTEGVLYLIDRLLNAPEHSYLLDKLELSIIPMANIDGAERMQRIASNGLDLNRDQTKLLAPESIILKKAFSDFNAEIGLDFHEYQPYRKAYLQMGNFGITPRFDVMFMYSENLNVNEGLRQYTKSRFVDNAARLLNEKQLSSHEYFTTEKVNGAIQINQGGLSARSSATAYALTNAISSLIEIRGVDLGRTSFKRRVYSTFLVAYSYLKTAYDNFGEVKAQINQAITDPDSTVVVKTESPVNKQKIEVIDMESYELTEIEVNLRDAGQTRPTLTRKRPSAYILLPEQKNIIEKLKVLGIIVTQLKRPVELEVENYVVTQYDLATEQYEGVFRQEVKTRTQNIKYNFPVDTYVIRLNQPKANLAIEVLEPETSNGFVSFSVLKTDNGLELPVYRYMNEVNF